MAITRQEILDGLARLLGEDPAPAKAPVTTQVTSSAPATQASSAPADTGPDKATEATEAPARDYHLGELVTAPNGEPAIVVAKDTSTGVAHYKLGYFASVSEGAQTLP